MVTILPPLAGDGQGPVPAFQAQVLDVGAGSLGDPQPVQGEQGDQGVLACRPEPGGDQQGTEFVAVQRHGMGLVVHPRTADMRGRRGAEEFFFDRVPAGPGDGGQPPGDRGAGPAPLLQVPGEALDAGAAGGEQGQGPGPAPGGELAQVQGVGLAGQAAVPGQEPGEGDPFGVGEDGLDRGERGGWDSSGHGAPPGQAETGKLGRSRSQRFNGTPT
jgi:hypothetical protein